MARRLSPLAADTLMAAATAAFTIWSTLLLRERGNPDLNTAGVALVLAQSLPLAFRRRAPLAVGTVVGAAAMTYGIGEHPDPFFYLGPMIAIYTIAARTARHVASLIGAAIALSVVVALVAAGDSDLEDTLRVLVMGLAWIVGRSVHHLTEQRDEAAAQRDAAAASAVADERARIARELHDVVAHHVGMMVVQAEAGAAAATSNAPGAATAAFDAIAGTGRQAMAEMRRLLSVMRADLTSDGAPAAPQPGLERLDELVDAVRGTGLAVEVRVEGPPRPLPPGADLSAYRVVQEALTNVVRHAGRSTRATVVIRYTRADLEVEVVNDGRDPRRPSSPVAGQGPGHGLVGMHERVSLFGGSLAAGPVPGGGFRVAARLPT